MSPRPYNLGKRSEQIAQSRRQVLEAARALLGEATGYTAFTVDAVAKRADVARATVYYQFGSKVGLLEAICDDLGEIGQLSGLAEAFTNPDADQALDLFITCFGRFWQADRIVMRRLRGLAALDPEVGEVIAARDHRRHEGLGVLVSRFAASGSAPAAVGRSQHTRTLLALTSFETFDTLAEPDQDLLEVAPVIIKLALSVLRT